MKFSLGTALFLCNELDYEICCDLDIVMSNLFLADAAGCNDAADTLYLYPAEYLESGHFTVPTYSLILAGNKLSVKAKRHLEKNACYIVIRSDKSVSFVLNSFIRRLSLLAEWESRCMNMIYQGCTLTAILDEFSRLIPYPMLLIDYSMTILAATTSHDPALETDGFIHARELGVSPSAIVRNPAHSMISRKLKHSDSLLVQEAISASNQKNVYRSFKNEENMIASACVFLGDQAVLPGCLEVMELFFKKLDIFFSKNQEIEIAENRAYEYFLNSMIKSKLPLSDPTFHQRLNYMNIPLEGQFCLLLFHFYQASDIPVQYYARIIHQYLPGVKPFIVLNQLCIFYDFGAEFPKHQQILTQLMDLLSQALAQHNFQCYISNQFYVLNDIYDAFLQCKFMEKTSACPPEKHFIFYKDNLFSHIFYELEKIMPLNSLLDPVYVFLCSYDQKHHTRYCNFLHTYYLENGNIKKIAATLKMHRNTVTHYIQRLEEMLGLELSSDKIRDHFEISYHIERYFKSRNLL